jgi:hypothetical protein
VQIEVVRNQCAVGQPDPASSAGFPRPGGYFHLEATVVVPETLNPIAMNHFVSAKQASAFIPLTAGPMEQIILVGFFGGEHAILVPSAGNAIPQAIFQWHSLTKLSTSIKASLGGGAHNSSLDGQWLRHLHPLLNTKFGEKPTGCFNGQS